MTSLANANDDNPDVGSPETQSLASPVATVAAGLDANSQTGIPVLVSAEGLSQALVRVPLRSGGHG